MPGQVSPNSVLTSVALLSGVATSFSGLTSSLTSLLFNMY